MCETEIEPFNKNQLIIISSKTIKPLEGKMSCIWARASTFAIRHFYRINKQIKNEQSRKKKIHNRKKLVNQMSVTVTCAFSIPSFFRLLFIQRGWVKQKKMPIGPMVFIMCFRCICITKTANASKQRTQGEKKAKDFMGIVLILERFLPFLLYFRF